MSPPSLLQNWPFPPAQLFKTVFYKKKGTRGKQAIRENKKGCMKQPQTIISGQNPKDKISHK